MVTATVPYDIVPQTQIEAYVTALCLSVGLLLNAFVIGSMASALSSIDSKKQVCAGRLETIGHYLHLNYVKPELRAKILGERAHMPRNQRRRTKCAAPRANVAQTHARTRTPRAPATRACTQRTELLRSPRVNRTVCLFPPPEYYEYLYTSSNSSPLEDLPACLATRLALTVHRKIIVRSAFFASLSDVALLGVLHMLTSELRVAGEVLMVEGQVHTLPLNAHSLAQPRTLSLNMHTLAQPRTLSLNPARSRRS